MTKPVPPPANLRDWSTSRLRLLLAEYSESLPHVRVLYGEHHPETETFASWVKAIADELARRP